MPAVIAHHLFGIESYPELTPVIGTDDRARNAFLLGNQGPDPLFCLKVLPESKPYRGIGPIMHGERTAMLLHALHRRCAQSENGVVRAYALGFLCHYLLDSTVHPLVYAQQHALCDAAWPAVDGGTVHAAIETELDEHILHAKLGLTVGEFSPHRETLGCDRGALASVSAAVADVVNDAYGITMPRNAFTSSVRLYRAAQRAVDSKRKGLRQHIDYARLTGSRYPHVLALTHSASRHARTVFTNDDHIPWPHPFEPDAIVSASFDELYDRALARAARVFPRFTRCDFNAEDCEGLDPTLNFRGEHIGSNR